MPAPLSQTVSAIDARLAEREKRQDAALALNRDVVRGCARAIKLLHENKAGEAREAMDALRDKLDALLHASAGGLEHLSQTALQEYVEAQCLLAFLERREPPAPDELGVDDLAWLNGLADASGELRRALQLALRDGRRDDADYYFQKLNEIHDNLFPLKYASSLVGALKRKQDVLRVQVEYARGELLRAST